MNHPLSPGIRETFSHTDDDGTVRHFNIPMLQALIRARPQDWKLIALPVTREQALFIAKARGVEEARLKAYPLAKLDEPGIACLFEDESILTVDGNHRFVKRYRRGLKTMQFWVAHEPVWRQALVPEGSFLPISPPSRR